MFKNYKSPETFNLKTLESNYRVMNSNILYITHEIDQIKKIVIQLINATKLQKQVDEYFDEPSEEMPRTSPQTDTENKYTEPLSPGE